MPPRAIPVPRNWNEHVRAGFLNAISLAHLAITSVRGWCVNSPIARVRLASENERLTAELALVREELRIKDSRLARIPARQRPHYPPTERLAILALKAARGWSAAQTARHFLLSPATIASWTTRLEEDGPDALVQLPQPVNRFPELVGQIVRRLKLLCPAMGKKRIARTLARAGLHLGVTTVRRALQHSSPPDIAPAPSKPEAGRTVTARYAHHVWHTDLTIVPTAAGMCLPWLPFAMLQSWPFCWWVMVIVDHFSRCAVGFATFDKQPTAKQVCAALELASSRVGRHPKYIISDHGVQFRSEYQQWCSDHGVKPRFGAIGRYGSIAVAERFILSMKNELTRRLLVPLGLARMRSELASFFNWYNVERPHEFLDGATPVEILLRRRPANKRPRLEPRPRYPADARCAAPSVKAREVGCVLKLVVSGPQHLPVVRLKKAA